MKLGIGEANKAETVPRATYRKREGPLVVVLARFENRLASILLPNGLASFGYFCVQK